MLASRILIILALLCCVTQAYCYYGPSGYTAYPRIDYCTYKSDYVNYPYVFRAVLLFNWIDFLATLATACCFAGIGICYAYYLSIRFSTVGNKFSSHILNLLLLLFKQPPFIPQTLRTIFNNHINIISNPLKGQHTHPTSARIRNNSATFIDSYCATIGISPYYVQQSVADQRNNRSGSRSYFWAKDLSARQEDFNPGSDDILAFVDVDMYVDMPWFLAVHHRPYLISTFQPKKVCHSSGEYSFTFHSDNEVSYNVSGGAMFTHQVWNYSSDVLIATKSFCGIYTTCVYNVDRRQISDHHQIILLTPISSFYTPFHPKWLIDGNLLERYSVNVGNFSRLYVQTQDGMQVSTGFCGEYLETTISVTDDSAIASVTRLSKNPLTIAQVKQIVDVDQGPAAILTEYHRTIFGENSSIVYPVEDSIYGYQFDPKNYEPDATLPVHPFMSPFILECFVPANCRANDEACIDGRVVKVRASDNLSLTPFYAKCIQEWLELLIPIPHTGDPVDLDEVYNRQKRPSQRDILDKAFMSVDKIGKGYLQSFQKAESYQKINDPRNITTFPGCTKLHYSSFTYAYSDAVMKPQPWYAFSKTPLQVATRVAEICKKASEVKLTDFSRMDGRISKLLRTVEHACLVRYFKKKYLPELNELYASQHNQRGITKFGVKYDTHEIRNSGGPDTADFNSGDNGFLNYCALRRTRRNGAYLTPKQAFEALGIYGGDDGVTGEVDGDALVDSCQAFGQVIEINSIKRGARGVSFLARYYSPEVWFGGLDSMCDIRRQLAKFHTTHALPGSITPMRKLGEKLLSFEFTDKNTPLISLLIKVARLKHPEIFPVKLGLDGCAGIASYHSYHDGDVQFPNEYGTWMADELDYHCPMFDVRGFDRWIRGVRDGTNSILSPPLCEPEPTEPLKSKQPVVVNGEVVGKPEAVVKMCKLFLEGKCTYGEKCKFTHNKADASPCRAFKRGHCDAGDKCVFYHPTVP